MKDFKRKSCFVKVHSSDDGVIVGQVQGIMFSDYAKITTVDNLWRICFTHRMELPSYFDFFGKRDIHAHNNYFYMLMAYPM